MSAVIFEPYVAPFKRSLTSKVLDRVLHGGDASSLGGEVVRGHEDILGTGGFALLSRGLQEVEVPGHEGQLAAEAGEMDGRAAADAGARPGDQDDLSL